MGRNKTGFTGPTPHPNCLGPPNSAGKWGSRDLVGCDPGETGQRVEGPPEDAPDRRRPSGRDREANEGCALNKAQADWHL